MAQVDKHRDNPFKPISDRLARRCERYRRVPRGWLDESRIEQGFCVPLPEDMRQLLDVYAKLSAADEQKLYAMSEVLLDEESP